MDREFHGVNGENDNDGLFPDKYNALYKSVPFDNNYKCSIRSIYTKY